MARGPVDVTIDIPGEAPCPAHVPRDGAGRPNLIVRAVKMGFYPDPGAIRQRERQPGELFRLRHHREFAGIDEHPVGGWMEWAHLPSEYLDPASVPITTAPQLIADPLRMTQANNKMEVPHVVPAAPQAPFRSTPPIAGSQVPGTAAAVAQGAPAWPVEQPALPGAAAADL